jgi:hypothetical protein
MNPVFVKAKSEEIAEKWGRLKFHADLKTAEGQNQFLKEFDDAIGEAMDDCSPMGPELLEECLELLFYLMYSHCESHGKEKLPQTIAREITEHHEAMAAASKYPSISDRHKIVSKFFGMSESDLRRVCRAVDRQRRFNEYKVPRPPRPL